MTVKILAFSGSSRTGSWNHKLVESAATIASRAGAEVRVVSLRDYELPLFDEDLEAAGGLPEGVLRLKDDMKASHAFLIACPKYDNSSITPALKNAIDWASRPREGEKPLECFAGKCAGLCTASPGGLGGVRGLDHVREILSNIQVHIVPPGVAVGSAHQAFNDDGTLANERQAGMLTTMVESVVRSAAALHST